MADFSITDSLGNPIELANVKWTSASSIVNYAKSESLHLVVAPDFLNRKDTPLSQAFSGPTTFMLSLEHDFQLGGAVPEVDLTPGASATLTVNTKPGSNLFDDDPFQLPATVPNGTGYVGLTLAGSVNAAVSASSGDLTAGMDAGGGVKFEFLKAFSTTSNQPTLGAATSATLSSYIIPAGVADLDNMGTNDISTVTGMRSLKVSGGINISTPVNPLASVNLPAAVGVLAVQAGAMTGLTASFEIKGSWQIRVAKLSGNSIQLSYLKEAGTTAEIDLSASAGISAGIGSSTSSTSNTGNTDLLAKLLGAVEKGGVDQKILDALEPGEIEDFNSAIKDGIDHSLRASIDLALSTETDRQAAFQYELRLDRFDQTSTDALNHALKGDLTLLTTLEEHAAPDGTIAPGIRLLNSIISTMRKKGTVLHVNLLGIVNLISMSALISKCEFLYEPASGDLTIKETAQSEKISAIMDPVRRQAAMREALFHSVLITTTYLVGKIVVVPSLSCQAVHFASTQNTSKQNAANYTNWFVALHLLSAEERAAILGKFSAGGESACTIRIALDDADAEALFFDSAGELRGLAEYQEVGRRALRALLDPDNSDIDSIRCQILDNPEKWAKAINIGPNAGLEAILPLQSTSPQYLIALNVVSGDVYDVSWWADSMQKAGQALRQTRSYLAGRDPASLKADPGFAELRDHMQKTMLDVVAKSKLRFDEPLGVLSIFNAAGSRAASGELNARGIRLLKSTATANAALSAGL